MVKLLFKKMLRDMKKSAVTYGVCIFIVAIGFCGYSVLSIAIDQLQGSKDFFFQTTACPQVFAEVHQAPVSITSRLAKIEGVARVEPRLVETVQIADGDGAELRLISVQANGLAIPLLSRGEMPLVGKNQLAIGDSMFKARHLNLGDSLGLVIDGKPVDFSIVGSGISPENIYMIKDMTTILPDPINYDAGFLPYDTMGALFSKVGLANDFVFTLKPGVSFDDVQQNIKDVLEPYGCYRVFDRSDQFSINMLETELIQLEKVTIIVPFLFLAVAAIILAITLHRLVEQQRTQAGTFLAVGISRRTINLHYLSYGTFIGFTGGVLGSLAGWLSAEPLVNFYRIYFNLPKVEVPVSMGYFVSGVLMATIFCGLTGWNSARRLGNLQPAEALRPAAPKAAKISFLERIPNFVKLFTVPGLLAIRSLARNRRRAFLALFGIACAFMITAYLISINALFNIFLFDELAKTQRQDISVSFLSPIVAEEALQAVRDPGVERAEGTLQFPVTLRGPKGENDSVLQAIADDSKLCRLYDKAGNQIYVDSQGIVLAAHLATILGVGVNDYIETEVAYPKQIVSKVKVTAIAAQYMGANVYMSYNGASRISDYHQVYTGVLLAAPPEVEERLITKLEDSPNVGTIESRVERLANYRLMLQNMLRVMASLGVMGVLIGIAVVYTSSLISFEELKREVATMMMLGLKNKQCLEVVSTEQFLLTIGGIILGIPMTLIVAKFVSISMTSDLYTIPSFLDFKSVIFAIVLTFFATWVSSLAMLHKIKKLSPVELLRERE